MRTLLLNMFNSWITTIALGVPGLMEIWVQIMAALDKDDTTVFSWEGLVIGVGLLVGGIVARDGNKSSEQVGAK